MNARSRGELALQQCLGSDATFREGQWESIERVGDCAPEGNRRLIEPGALPLDDDLEAEATGGLLARLLARAEQESEQKPARPAQQTLLSEDNGELGAPTSPVQNGLPVVQEERPGVPLRPGQLELHKDI